MKAEQVADLLAAGNVLQVIIAWRVVKRTHDIKSAEICCCKNTLKLFQTLDELERDVVGIVKEKL